MAGCCQPNDTATMLVIKILLCMINRLVTLSSLQVHALS